MSSRIDDHTLLLYDRSYHEYSTRELANILPVDQVGISSTPQSATPNIDASNDRLRKRD